MRPPPEVMRNAATVFLRRMPTALPATTGRFLHACGLIQYQLSEQALNAVLEHATAPGLLERMEGRHVNQHLVALGLLATAPEGDGRRCCLCGDTVGVAGCQIRDTSGPNDHLLPYVLSRPDVRTIVTENAQCLPFLASGEEENEEFVSSRLPVREDLLDRLLARAQVRACPLMSRDVAVLADI